MGLSFDIIRKNRLTIAVLAIVSILFCTVAIAHDASSSYDNHSGYSHQDLQHDDQPCEHTATPSAAKQPLPDMAILVPSLSVMPVSEPQQPVLLSYRPGNGRWVSRPLYLLDSRFRE